MDIDALVDELFTKSWSKISNGSKSNEFIYASQFTDLMEEVQTTISSGNLLNESEVKFLKEMINNKPLLKLYKSELSTFLLKMVGYSSLTKFITDRAGISLFNLKLILSNPSNTRSLRRDIPTGSETKPHSARRFEPDVTSTPVINRAKSHEGEYNSILLKEKQIIQRDNEISVMATENKVLQTELSEKNSKIRELENKYRELSSYIETLEMKFDNKSDLSSNSDRLIIRDLVSRCNDRDKTIKHLQTVIEDYENQVHVNESNPIITKLTNSIKIQQQLIDALTEKLNLKDSSKELTSFVTKLPFLKQFYMYFNYQRQHKNMGMIFMNVLTLFLSSIVMMTGLRIVFLMVLYVLSGETRFEYVLQDEDYDKISINWWQEFEWLEYLMYNLNDWLDGYSS
ncbi:hypothetical protein CLIB1444_07S04060 [[Candida] jaroonii]|uniref:Uncharacterized protein n=1 Tax=[Candida] jaroonii TaxID=467808 RepID=A0ACA9Y9X9_9ASCO|nr:hypothetical protein CLIB1444_07S04060 [[Candida] jaroonii]